LTGFRIIRKKPGPSGVRHQSAQEEMAPFTPFKDSGTAMERFLQPRHAQEGRLGIFRLRHDRWTGSRETGWNLI
jgi:hypothetical protein